MYERSHARRAFAATRRKRSGSLAMISRMRAANASGVTSLASEIPSRRRRPLQEFRRRETRPPALRQKRPPTITRPIPSSLEGTTSKSSSAKTGATSSRQPRNSTGRPSASDCDLFVVRRALQIEAHRRSRNGLREIRARADAAARRNSACPFSRADSADHTDAPAALRKKMFALQTGSRRTPLGITCNLSGVA